MSEDMGELNTGVLRGYSLSDDGVCVPSQEWIMGSIAYAGDCNSIINSFSLNNNVSLEQYVSIVNSKSVEDLLKVFTPKEVLSLKFELTAGECNKLKMMDSLLR